MWCRLSAGLRWDGEERARCYEMSGSMRGAHGFWMADAKAEAMAEGGHD